MSRNWPMDDEWTQKGWDPTFEVADRLTRDEATEALRSLRAVFPPALVPQLRAGHPISTEQWSMLGRVELLELGRALVTLQVPKRDIKRLRNPKEYHGAAAEVRAGFMAVQAGATLRRPSPTGRKACDYVAVFPDGTELAIEVKAPHQSDQQNRLQLVQSRILFAFMERLQELPFRGVVTLRFAPELKQLVRNPVDQALLERWAVDWAMRVRTAVSEHRVAEVVEIAPVGYVTLRSDPSRSGTAFDAYAEFDAEEESRRLRGPMLGATRQVNAVERPGSIVLDLRLNPFAKNARPYLERWTAQQPDLAGTLLVDHQYFGLRMHAYDDFLAGPLAPAATPLLEGAFELCELEHRHYCPVCSVEVPCPCEGWFPKATSTAGLA